MLTNFIRKTSHYMTYNWKYKLRGFISVPINDSLAQFHQPKLSKLTKMILNIK